MGRAKGHCPFACLHPHVTDWAKAAVWEHGGVGTGAHKVDIPGLPKPPVKSAFEVYVVEMLKQVNRDGDNSSAIRYAVREDASKKWKEMTELDKIKYENTATVSPLVHCTTALGLHSP